MSEPAPPQPRQVALVNPEGQLVAVPFEQQDIALTQGFKLPNVAQQSRADAYFSHGEGLGNTLAATAAGAARGLTFGGSDWALTHSGLVEPETLRQLKEQHGLASGLGEAGGIGLGLLGTGGLGAGVRGVAGVGEAVSEGAGLGLEALSKLGGKGLAERGLAARALAKGIEKGAGSAVEGAAYGAGQAVSEEALGEPDVNAQKVLAHIGLGAIFGGLGGGALGSFGEIGKAGVRNLTRLIGGGKGTSLAEAAMTREASGATSEAAAAEAGLNQPNSPPPADTAAASDMAARLKAKLEDIAGGKALESAGLMLKSYRKLQNANVNTLEKELGEAVAGEVDSLGLPTSEGARTTLLEESKRVMREKDIVKAGDSLADVAQKVQQTVDEAQANTVKFSKSLDELADKEGAARFNPREYANAIRKELVEPLKNRPSKEKIYEALKKEADKYEALADDVGESMSFQDAEQIKRDFDYLFDMNNAKGVNAALRQARGILNKQIEDKARPVAEKLGETAYAEWKSNKRTLQALLPVRDAAVDRIQRMTANRDLSPSDYATGLSTFMGGGGGPGGVVQGGLTSMAHKYVRERGNSFVADFANRAARSMSTEEGMGIAKLAGVERATYKVNRQIQRGIDSFVEGLDKPVRRAVAPASVHAMHRVFLGPAEKKEAADKHEAYRRRLGELAELTTSPETVMARMQENLGQLDHAAPSTATHLQITAMRAVSFLYDKAPKDPLASQNINPAHSKWRPSDTELATFERYLQAAQHPLSVLEDMQHGTTTPEAVEAVKTVYPALYSQIMQTLAPQLVETAKDLPLQARLQLATVFGVSVDALTSPALYSTLQQIHQAAAVPAGPAKPSTSGKNERANISTTPLQRALSSLG